MRAHVLNLWLRYREAHIARNCGPALLYQLNMAYYAGAREVLSLLMTNLSHGKELTDSDLALLRGINEELNEFVEQATGGIQ